MTIQALPQSDEMGAQAPAKRIKAAQPRTARQNAPLFLIVEAGGGRLIPACRILYCAKYCGQNETDGSRNMALD
jgi:hypothetical protein